MMMSSSRSPNQDWFYVHTLKSGREFGIRRISLAARLRFIADHHDLIQKVKMLGCNGLGDEFTMSHKVEAELELARLILDRMVFALEDSNYDSDLTDTILNLMPAEDASELLQKASEAFSLSPDQKKKLVQSIDYLTHGRRWDCESCVRQKLQAPRACGFVAFPPGDTPVWVGRKAVLHSCPESSLTGEELRWLQLWRIAQRSDGKTLLHMRAVDVDAIETINQFVEEHGNGK